MKKKGRSVVTLSTVLGALIGGSIWLAVYAGRAGVLEFDGVAGGSLMLSILAVGFVGGVMGIIYDIRHKRSAVRVLAFFALTYVAACLTVGFTFESYAQRKWSYSSIHPPVCGATVQPMPVACP